MKVPELLFAIINPVMRMLLRSPIHGWWSDSLMLITFTGRKSRRQFTTPVRYIRTGETIRCFTAAENQWWLNLRSPAVVRLHIKAKTAPYTAQAVYEDAAETRKWLLIYLGLFPQDAAHHNVRLKKDKSPVEADLDYAVANGIVVEANACAD